MYTYIHTHEYERERERDVEWMRTDWTDTHRHHELCLDSHANSQQQTNLVRAQPERAKELQRVRVRERRTKRGSDGERVCACVFM